MFAKLDEYIDSLPTRQGALISVLHHAQDIFEYLPIEVQTHIANKLDIPASKVYGVVTFYSFFTMTKKGKYKIAVCMGTACYVKDAHKILEKIENKTGVKAGETSEDGLYTVVATRCIGACGLAPIITINEDVHGKLHIDDIDKILEKYKG
jgi:NADH:ubiquinone oxidoreductase subunit E